VLDFRDKSLQSEVASARAAELAGFNAALDTNGVDRSLIRSNLRRTPLECLEALEDMLQLSETAHRVDESVR
jgi:hypothetical protein